MQKITLFVIIVFIGFSINAQSVQLDSTISYRDSLFEDPTEKFVYEYDDDGRHTKTIIWRLTGTNGHWEFKHTQMDSFEYNEQGLPVKFIGFSFFNNEYTEVSRTFLEYDDNGNNTRYLSQGKNESVNGWIDFWETRNTYEDDLLIASEHFSRDFLSGELAPIESSEYFFDSISGLLIEDLTYGYDFPNPERTLERRSKYFYNSEGHRERNERSRYDEQSMSFNLTSIIYYVKDNFGNNLQNISTRIDSDGNEIFTSRSTNDFDTNIAQSQASLPLNFFIRFEYDEHLILDYRREKWEDEKWNFDGRTAYFYSGLTQTNDQFNQKDLVIYPNPTNALIQFRNEELLGRKVDIQLIDSGGATFNSTANDGKLNISHLPTGVYNILLRNESSVYKSRLIKY